MVPKTDNDLETGLISYGQRDAINFIRETTSGEGDPRDEGRQGETAALCHGILFDCPLANSLGR